MPTSLPTAQPFVSARAESRSTAIAAGLLITWAAAMLLIQAVARYAPDAAAMDSFAMIAGF